MDAAGWFPDPLAVHRVRYWDGVTWTDLVADGRDAFTDPARERRFTAEVFFVAGPFLLSIWGFIAFGAVVYGPVAVKLFFGSLWLLLALWLLRMPYAAIVDVDGNLTFRALSRRTVTTVDAVTRMSTYGNRGRFDLGAGHVIFGATGGQRLAEFIALRRPDLPDPTPRRRRRH